MTITLNKSDFCNPDLFWGAVEDLILIDISEEQLDDVWTVEVVIKELDVETGLEDNYVTVKFANQDSKTISL
tara:strand:+ start:946 stop:1161 length:216 start_codon:yes stop_codon:yes gene_type:complete